MAPDSKDNVSRRRLLASIGAAAATGPLAGCNFFGGDSPERPTETVEATATTAAPEIPRSDKYGTVVDLVEAGADPQGEESVLPLLEEHGGDDTLLYFPEGQYLMEDSWILDSFSRLGIYGDDATIITSTGNTGPPHCFYSVV